MDTVTYYDGAGRITLTYSGLCLDRVDLIQAGQERVDGTFAGDTHYILDGEPTERPSSPITRTDLTLHDVPNGATLFINGESYPAEGEVELEFPMAGSYQLRVECFPFLDWNDEVTV